MKPIYDYIFTIETKEDKEKEFESYKVKKLMEANKKLKEEIKKLKGDK